MFPVGVHSRDVGFHLRLLALSIRLLAETCGSASDLVGADGGTPGSPENLELDEKLPSVSPSPGFFLFSSSSFSSIYDAVAQR